MISFSFFDKEEHQSFTEETGFLGFGVVTEEDGKLRAAGRIGAVVAAA